MKMLFSPFENSEVKQVKKKLSDAGIRCHMREVTLSNGEFGAPICPELLIEDEQDILEALKLIGAQRLRQMTVIFPTH